MEQRPSCCYVGVVLLVMALNAWYFLAFKARSHEQHRMRSFDDGADGAVLTGARNDTEIALLLSFPNSGTSYTMANIEQLTKTTGGTNYDGEVPSDECCPMVVELAHSVPEAGIPESLKEAAPFIHRPQERLPRVVLTKTHCKTDSTAFDEFAQACYSVVYDSNSPGNEMRVPYSKDLRLNRYVHLIRSPMDNLVSRKHMAVRRSVRMGTLHDPSRAAFLMNDTAESFQAWCMEFDKRHWRGIVHRNHSHVLDKWLSDVSQSPGYIPIPCVSDLFWYVTWHNFALQLTADKPDVYLLYYEDYSTNYNETMASLLGFLDLPSDGSPVPFDATKTYNNYYTDDQRDALEAFVRRLSTKETWNLLRRYFD